MGKGADYIILYSHMETQARLMDVEELIQRGDREAAQRAVERALASARETATMIEQLARAQGRTANDPR